MNLFWTLAQGAPPAATGGGPAGSDWDVLAAVLAAGPVVKGVMLLLLLFSVLSWAIIIAKFRQLRRAAQENALFLERFAQSGNLGALLEAARGFPASPAAAIFRRACEAPSAGWEGGVGAGQGPGAQASPPAEVPGPSPANPFRQDAARRAVRQALTGQVQLLSRQLSFLATCGNTAPFIGLFGTVWGIMSSFRQIGLTGSASLATVAPGIAEALIATAAGLAAAIPAVVAYNYFLGRVRRLEAELADFAGDLMSLLGRPGGPPPAA